MQQLPEPLLQEINDFIDFILHKHQPSTVNPQPQTNLSGEWADWFKVVDGLEVSPTEPISEYQQRLLTKYRQQGLNL